MSPSVMKHPCVYPGRQREGGGKGGGEDGAGGGGLGDGGAGGDAGGWGAALYAVGH